MLRRKQETENTRYQIHVRCAHENADPELQENWWRWPFSRNGGRFLGMTHVSWANAPVVCPGKWAAARDNIYCPGFSFQTKQTCDFLQLLPFLLDIFFPSFLSILYVVILPLAYSIYFSMNLSTLSSVCDRILLFSIRGGCWKRPHRYYTEITYILW